MTSNRLRDSIPNWPVPSPVRALSRDERNLYGAVGAFVGTAGPAVTGPGSVFVGGACAGEPCNVSDAFAKVIDVSVPFDR